MADSQTTVYLEDIDATHTKKREKPDDDDLQAGSCTTAPAPVKRQRTLAEMFSGDPGKISTKSASLQPPGGSTSSIALDSATVTRPKASGLVKLNSIPFSMNTYQESLSDEEKRLLRLECEVMGKSWQVICLWISLYHL